MELSTAVELIAPGVEIKQIQSWADLGAGDGLFTNALSTLLPGQSEVFAIDRDSSVNAIRIEPIVQLHIIQKDFSDKTITVPLLDGILIANALHFVRDKIPFLQQWKMKLKPNGVFIIVEYDIDKGSQWVPYPISMKTMQQLKVELNAKEISEIGRSSSRYRKEGMYSALIKF